MINGRYARAYREDSAVQEELDSRRVSAGCFSASSQIIDLQLVSIALKDLTVGSEVATRDVWSTVASFLHWHPDDEIDAMTITFEHGTLTLTPAHMVFVVAQNRQERVIAAMEVMRHALVLVQKEYKIFPSVVHSVQSVKMSGFYALVTISGTIVVDHVVASCYSRWQDRRESLDHPHHGTLAARASCQVHVCTIRWGNLSVRAMAVGHRLLVGKHIALIRVPFVDIPFERKQHSRV